MDFCEAASAATRALKELVSDLIVWMPAVLVLNCPLQAWQYTPSYLTLERRQRSVAVRAVSSNVSVLILWIHHKPLKES
jgi:hypothetical protein